jgi:hypothetical protein
MLYLTLPQLVDTVAIPDQRQTERYDDNGPLSSRAGKRLSSDFAKYRPVSLRMVGFHPQNGLSWQNDSPRLSHDAVGAQFPHLGLAHPEAAENLGVVLAELGGDGAHPHTLADLDRVRMCGTSPKSESLANCTRPRWRTCGSANICP